MVVLVVVCSSKIHSFTRDEVQVGALVSLLGHENHPKLRIIGTNLKEQKSQDTKTIP
jgi:hypothetical protein